MKYLSMFDNESEFKFFANANINAKSKQDIFAILNKCIDEFSSQSVLGKCFDDAIFKNDIIANVAVASLYTLKELKYRNDYKPMASVLREKIYEDIDHINVESFSGNEMTTLKNAYQRAQGNDILINAYLDIDGSKELKIGGYDKWLATQIILNAYMEPGKSAEGNSCGGGREFYGFIGTKANVEKSLIRFFKKYSKSDYERNKNYKNQIIEAIEGLQAIKFQWDPMKNCSFSDRLIYEYEKEQIFHCNVILNYFRNLAKRTAAYENKKISEESFIEDISMIVLKALSPLFVDADYMISMIDNNTENKKDLFSDESPLLALIYFFHYCCANIVHAHEDDIDSAIDGIEAFINGKKTRSLWLYKESTQLRGHVDLLKDDEFQEKIKIFKSYLPSDSWWGMHLLIKGILYPYRHGSREGVWIQLQRMERELRVLAKYYTNQNFENSATFIMEYGENIEPGTLGIQRKTCDYNKAIGNPTAWAAMGKELDDLDRWNYLELLSSELISDVICTVKQIKQETIIPSNETEIIVYPDSDLNRCCDVHGENVAVYTWNDYRYAAKEVSSLNNDFVADQLSALCSVFNRVNNFVEIENKDNLRINTKDIDAVFIKEGLVSPSFKTYNMIMCKRKEYEDFDEEGGLTNIDPKEEEELLIGRFYSVLRIAKEEKIETLVIDFDERMNVTFNRFFKSSASPEERAKFFATIVEKFLMVAKTASPVKKIVLFNASPLFNNVLKEKVENQTSYIEAPLSVSKAITYCHAEIVYKHIETTDSANN